MPNLDLIFKIEDFINSLNYRYPLYIAKNEDGINIAEADVRFELEELREEVRILKEECKSMSDYINILEGKERTPRKYATIIGSRKASEQALTRLKMIADALASMDYVLRSGGAEGADSIVTDGNFTKEIIIPWSGFNNLKHNPESGVFLAYKLPDYKVAQSTIQKIHPTPDKLSKGALALHTRNVYQITGIGGVNRDNLSRVVVYAAPEKNGKVSGGTATAVNLARTLKIKTYNVCIAKEYEELKNKLGVK